MRRSGTCPKCGSKEVAVHVRAIDHREDQGEVDLEVGNDLGRSRLAAWVCGACGFVEYYARNPHMLVPWDEGVALPAGGPPPQGGAAAGFQAGDLVEAVRSVQGSGGRGHEETLDRVDTAAHRQELRDRIGASRAEVRKGCIALAVLLGLLLAGAAVLLLQG